MSEFLEFIIDSAIFLIVYMIIGKLWEYSECHAGILLSCGVIWGIARNHKKEKQSKNLEE